MDQEEKWKAVVYCDKNCDGLFFYAVKTTGIVCRPSCKAKTPLRGNVLFYDDINKAIGEGFRPCKMCRPDFLELEYQPNKEAMEKAKILLKAASNQSSDFSSIAKQLGFSSSHFSRLFKQCCGISPGEFVTSQRIAQAKELLEHSDQEILSIAFQVGFKSLSNFYKCFGEQAGVTPKEYRRIHQIMKR